MFPYGDEWKQLVASLEHALRLHGHAPGTVIKLGKYLHQRTGGTIGSLSRLIRKTAIRAILTGDEMVTMTQLDKVRIDRTAESASRRADSDF